MRQKQIELLENLRRIWQALRRELGRTESLAEDFESIAREKLQNSGLFSEITTELISCQILNY